MEKLSTTKYNKQITKAIRHFWNTRHSQASNNKKKDQGNRGSVTGGKQLDGFIELLAQVAKDMGVPSSCIFTKGNILPGYFRPTKDWDFLIISPKGHLIAVIELKSQVGSFGNNFNNRTEEALGSAVDFWTSYRENSFPQAQQPWIGYLLLVEKSKDSTKKLSLKEPHFDVRSEFQETSYLDRYMIFCQKLMKERHYTSSALIWSTKKAEFACPKDEISTDSFLLSFMGFLKGKEKEFEQ